MRRMPSPTAAFTVLVLLALTFAAGVAADRNGMLPKSTLYEPAEVAPAFSIFWETWDIVQEHFVDRSAIDFKKMTYGATAGLLDSLGDSGHTRFLSPDDLKAEQEALSGQLQGIGAEMVVRDGAPTVLAPIPGSPAQAAGVRPGDIIVRVDDQDITGMSLEQIVRLVRGPPGTSVRLTIIHAGDTTLSELTIQRAQVTVPNVTWAKLPGTDVAHILMSQFGERATSDLVSALNGARSRSATSIILDLRNDPGGLRDEAITAASQFLSNGDVLLEQDSQGKRTNFPVRTGGIATDVPMVVLINEGTASAAEIVAGALQDHQRAKLVGATTFGTGTVLGTFDLSDGSAVLLGIAEWLTPNGRQIWHHGIAPDIKVTLPAGAFPSVPQAESEMTLDQFKASDDAQLLRALQELTSPTRP